jgi:hypothetical protein
MQSVSITTNVVSSNPVHGEVYSIQHYVIKFVSDLRQFGGFLQVPWFPPSIKLFLTSLGLLFLLCTSDQHKKNIPTKFVSILPSGFREEDYNVKVYERQ